MALPPAGSLRPLFVALSVVGLALVACGGDVVVDASPGTTTTSTTSGSGGAGAGGSFGTGNTGGIGGGETGLEDCACACTILMSAGGCADLCSTLVNGATSPNFCEGNPPLSMCAACLGGSCSALGTAAGTCTGM